MAKDPFRPLDYLVLPLAELRAATNGLPPSTLGILLQLLIRCASELNGGRIANAAATTAAPQCNIPGLWHWEGDSLMLDIYPADYETKTIAKRHGYAANALARWEKQRPACNGTDANAIVYQQPAHGIQTAMQWHADPCNGIASADSACNGTHAPMPLHPCAPARVTVANNNIWGDSRGTGQPTPPPTDNEEFNQWKQTLIHTHPAGKRMRSLPYDVLCSAWQAFQCLPDILDLVPLLSAYMADKLQTDRFGKRYFRASGLARYFDTLADHLAAAERWARETGFHRRSRPPVPQPTQNPATEATDTDISTFLQSIKNTHDHTSTPTSPDPA